MKRILGIILLLFQCSCAPMMKSPLYPDSFSVGIRTPDRVAVDGMTFGLSWKLKPVTVELPDKKSQEKISR